MVKVHSLFLVFVYGNHWAFIRKAILIVKLVSSIFQSHIFKKKQLGQQLASGRKQHENEMYIIQCFLKGG